MADESIRSDEEPEVEGHGFPPEPDEGNVGTQEEDEDEVEAHGFQMGNIGGNIGGNVGGNIGGNVGGNIG